MNKHPRITLSIFIILLLTTGCFFIGSEPGIINEVEPTRTTTANCPALPENFKESDLIGTWTASYTLDTDTLVLREDGKYKQIYDNPKADFHFESDWQTWWVEYRDVGYLWLHMEGMRRCDDLP